MFNLFCPLISKCRTHIWLIDYITITYTKLFVTFRFLWTSAPLHCFHKAILTAVFCLANFKAHIRSCITILLMFTWTHICLFNIQLNFAVSLQYRLSAFFVDLHHLVYCLLFFRTNNVIMINYCIIICFFIL